MSHVIPHSGCVVLLIVRFIFIFEIFSRNLYIWWYTRNEHLYTAQVSEWKQWTQIEYKHMKPTSFRMVNNSNQRNTLYITTVFPLFDIWHFYYVLVHRTTLNKVNWTWLRIYDVRTKRDGTLNLFVAAVCWSLFLLLGFSIQWF